MKVNKTINHFIMKEIISKTPHYSLEIDILKKRAYFTVLNRWNGIEDFSTFNDSWYKAVQALQPSFTILADLRRMPILSKQVEGLFSEMHNYFMENGLFRVAEVASMNDISELQISRLEERNEITQNRFATIEAAEKYLDELVNS